MNILVFGDGNHSEHHQNTKKYKLKYDDISGWLIENLLINSPINNENGIKRDLKWQ